MEVRLSKPLIPHIGKCSRICCKVCNLALSSRCATIYATLLLNRWCISAFENTEAESTQTGCAHLLPSGWDAT